MYTVSFIFRPGEYDEEFHRLNAEIDAVAEATPGFIGAESWLSADGTLRNALYYWEDLEPVAAFSQSATHLYAKANYRRWYDGYQIVIAKVTDSHGDGRIGGLAVNRRVLSEPQSEGTAP